jgi:hypothetical protein
LPQEASLFENIKGRFRQPNISAHWKEVNIFFAINWLKFKLIELKNNPLSAKTQFRISVQASQL